MMKISSLIICIIMLMGSVLKGLSPIVKNLEVVGEALREVLVI